MKKAYGYCRVSTEDQGASGEGYEVQVQAVNELFERKLKDDGFRLVDILYDKAESGSVPMDKRPKGAELLLRVRPGDAVILPKVDRSGRSLRDVLNVFHKWNSEGVHIVCGDLFGALAFDGKDPFAWVMLGMIAMGAEMMRAHTVVANRALVKRQKARGSPVGKPYFGFRSEYLGTNKFQTLVPDEREQWVMRSVVAWRDKGHSLSECVRGFAKLGVTSRAGKPFSKFGITHLERKARHLLRLEAYLKAQGQLGPGQYVLPTGTVMTVPASRGKVTTAAGRADGSRDFSG